MKPRGIGKSDVGRVRSNNEDSFWICNERIGAFANVYVVADGMGGHNAGEIASAKSINFFQKQLRQSTAKQAMDEKGKEALLVQAVEAANEGVYALSVDNLAQNGMGTTFTVCSVENGTLYYAHIGDSRLYVLTDSEIRQITEDHTFVNEMVKLGELTPAQARNHPKRNMLTRALGTETDALVDSGWFALPDNAKVLLCSDGLTTMLSDNEILQYAGTGKAEEIMNKLIETANARGGFDNVSVIIIQ